MSASANEQPWKKVPHLLLVDTQKEVDALRPFSVPGTSIPVDAENAYTVSFFIFRKGRLTERANLFSWEGVMNVSLDDTQGALSVYTNTNMSSSELTTVPSNKPLPTAELQHVAIVLKGNLYKIYFGGQLVHEGGTQGRPVIDRTRTLRFAQTDGWVRAPAKADAILYKLRWFAGALDERMIAALSKENAHSPAIVFTIAPGLTPIPASTGVGVNNSRAALEFRETRKSVLDMGAGQLSYISGYTLLAKVRFYNSQGFDSPFLRMILPPPEEAIQFKQGSQNVTKDPCQGEEESGAFRWNWVAITFYVQYNFAPYNDAYTEVYLNGGNLVRYTEATWKHGHRKYETMFTNPILSWTKALVGNTVSSSAADFDLAYLRLYSGQMTFSDIIAAQKEADAYLNSIKGPPTLTNYVPEAGMIAADLSNPMVGGSARLVKLPDVYMLTPKESSRHAGAISWAIPSAAASTDRIVVEFDAKVDGNGDALYFFWGALTAPMHEAGTSTGFMIILNETQPAISLSYNGVPATTLPVSIGFLNSGVYKRVRIERTPENGWTVLYDGVKLSNGVLGPMGTKGLFGFGARTGVMMTEHSVKNLNVWFQARVPNSPFLGTPSYIEAENGQYWAQLPSNEVGIDPYAPPLQLKGVANQTVCGSFPGYQVLQQEGSSLSLRHQNGQLRMDPLPSQANYDFCWKEEVDGSATRAYLRNPYKDGTTYANIDGGKLAITPLGSKTTFTYTKTPPAPKQRLGPPPTTPVDPNAARTGVWKGIPFSGLVEVPPMRPFQHREQNMHMVLTHPSNPSPEPAFTMSFWLRKHDQILAWRNILQFGATERERLPGIYFHDGAAPLHVAFSTSHHWNETVSLPATRILPENVWVHLAIVVKGTKVEIYMQGNLVVEKQLNGNFRLPEGTKVPVRFATYGDPKCEVAKFRWLYKALQREEIQMLSTESNSLPLFPPHKMLVGGFRDLYRLKDQPLRTANITASEGDSFTLSFWIYKQSVVCDWRNLIHIGEDEDQCLPAIYMKDNEAPLAVYMTTTARKESIALTRNQHLPIFQWTHVALVFDHPTLRLFIDGKELATQQMAGFPKWVANPVVRFATYGNPRAYISKVRWFSEALMGQVIRQLAGDRFDLPQIDKTHVPVTQPADIRALIDQRCGAEEEAADKPFQGLVTQVFSGDGNQTLDERIRDTGPSQMSQYVSGSTMATALTSGSMIAEVRPTPGLFYAPGAARPGSGSAVSVGGSVSGSAFVSASMTKPFSLQMTNTLRTPGSAATVAVANTGPIVIHPDGRVTWSRTLENPGLAIARRFAGGKVNVRGQIVLPEGAILLGATFDAKGRIYDVVDRFLPGIRVDPKGQIVAYSWKNPSPMGLGVRVPGTTGSAAGTKPTSTSTAAAILKPVSDGIVSGARPSTSSTAVGTKPSSVPSSLASQIAAAISGLRPGTSPAGTKPVTPGTKPMTPGTKPVTPGTKPRTPGAAPAALRPILLLTPEAESLVGMRVREDGKVVDAKGTVMVGVTAREDGKLVDASGKVIQGIHVGKDGTVVATYVPLHAQVFVGGSVTPDGRVLDRNGNVIPGATVTPQGMIVINGQVVPGLRVQPPSNKIVTDAEPRPLAMSKAPAPAPRAWSPAAQKGKKTIKRGLLEQRYTYLQKEAIERGRASDVDPTQKQSTCGNVPIQPRQLVPSEPEKASCPVAIQSMHPLLGAETRFDQSLEAEIARINARLVKYA